MSCNIEEILFNDSLSTAREKINTVYTGSTQIWSGSVGSQSVISVGDGTNVANSTRSIVAGGVNNTIAINSTNSAIIGGENNIISGSSHSSVILGGSNNKIQNAPYSVIVAGDGITANTRDTTYVDNLKTSGHRHRNVRTIEQVYYQPGAEKIPSIASNDDIILIDDQTVSTGTIDPSTDYTLGISGMITQDEVGRVVDIVLTNNTGFFSVSAVVGVVLLSTGGDDFKINNWQRSVQLAAGDPGFYPLFMSPAPGTGVPATLGQSVSLMYMGKNDSNVPEFVAWGTGVWYYV